MTVLRALNIAMNVDTKRLDRDLYKARRSWRKYSRQVSSTVRGMARTVSLVSGIVAVGIGAGLRSAAQAADDIAKNARSTNLTVRNYQRLAHAFDIVGIGADNVVKVFATLTKATTFAHEKQITYIRAFERAGIEVNNIVNLTTKELFFRVVEGISQISNKTLQMATMNELLGRKGKVAGTLISLSRQELERFGDELESVGGIINGSLDVVENFNDAMTTLKRTVQARFANVLIESLQLQTGSALGITKTIGDAVEITARKFIGLIKAMVDYRNEIQLVITAILAWKAATLALTLVIGVGGLTLALTSIIVTVTKMVVVVATGGAAMAAFGAALTTMATSPLVVGAALFALAGIVYLLAQSWNEAVEVMRGHWNILVTAVDIGGQEFQRIWIQIKQAAVNTADVIVGVFRVILNTFAFLIEGFLAGLDYITRRNFNLIDIALPRFEKTFGVLSDKIAANSAEMLAWENTMQSTLTAAREDTHKLNEAWDKFGDAFTNPVEGLKASPLLASLAFYLGDAYEKLKQLGNAPPTLPTVAGVRLPTTKMAQDIDDEDVIGPLVTDIKRSIGPGVVVAISSSINDAIATGKFEDIGRLLFDRIHAVFLEALIAKFVTRPLGTFLHGIFPNFFPEAFHQGGIVPGVSGAERIARVQAGEMILTESQQAHIASRMNSGNVTLQITGDVTRETERAVVRLLPQIAAAVEGNRLASA